MAKDKDNENEDTEENGQALWDMVARTVKPLKHNKFHSASVDPKADQDDRSGAGKGTPKEKKQSVREKTAFVAPSSAEGLSSLQDQAGAGELDKRLNERLRRGQLPIDMRIDLHGHTQAEAHHILQTTLIAAHRAQKRCILVITGKGRHSPREDDSRKLHHGVLKQKVPEWLSTPPLSDIVLKYHGARPKDGGAGALYVLLRRKR